MIAAEASAEPEVAEPTAAEAGVEPEVVEPERAERKYTYAFNVFRKSSTEDFYPRKPVNANPVEGSRFEDRRVVFGESWCYIVRAVAVAVPEEPIPTLVDPAMAEGASGEAPASSGQPTPSVQTTPAPAPVASPPLQGAAVPPGAAQVPLAPPPLTAPLESGDSEEVCLIPQDTFAPATPSDVFAVASSEGILLSWREVDAPDLRGYLVYRANRSEGPFDLLTPEPIRLASLTDRSVEPGEEYYYQIRAVDLQEPPNESPPSVILSARAPEP